MKGQTRNQAEIAALQGAIASEYTMMKRWESKYNSYLKTAQGYGTSLKASMSIYSEGVRTLRYLWEIKKAIGRNPEGAFATFSMNNLYLETGIGVPESVQPPELDGFPRWHEEHAQRSRAYPDALDCK
jgi:hypothetical protein